MSQVTTYPLFAGERHDCAECNVPDFAAGKAGTGYTFNNGNSVFCSRQCAETHLSRHLAMPRIEQPLGVRYAEQPATVETFPIPTVRDVVSGAAQEPARFKGDPFPDPDKWAAKALITRDLARSKPAQFQNSLLPDVPDANGQVSLF